MKSQFPEYSTCFLMASIMYFILTFQKNDKFEKCFNGGKEFESALNVVIKTPDGMPASHILMPGFKSQL